MAVYNDDVIRCATTQIHEHIYIYNDDDDDNAQSTHNFILYKHGDGGRKTELLRPTEFACYTCAGLFK